MVQKPVGMLSGWTAEGYGEPYGVAGTFAALRQEWIYDQLRWYRRFTLVLYG